MDIEYKLDGVNKRITLLDEKQQQVKTEVGHLHKQNEDAHVELVELKEQYRLQSERFISEIRKLNHHMNMQVDSLEKHDSRLDQITEKHDKWLEMNDEKIHALQNRMHAAETNIIELVKETELLKAVKLDVTVFERVKRALELEDIK